MSRRQVDPRGLALTAVLTAIVFLLTRLVQVPTPIGYIHLGDVGVFFSALAFGPWAGAVAGGLGTCLADLTSGPYATWAPYSLIIHGLEAWVVGWLGRRWGGPLAYGTGAVLGSAIVIAGYFAAGAFGLRKGVAAAAAELPLNVVQVAVGAIVGISLYLAVRRAYPPISGPSQTQRRGQSD